MRCVVLCALASGGPDRKGKSENLASREGKRWSLECAGRTFMFGALLREVLLKVRRVRRGKVLRSPLHPHTATRNFLGSLCIYCIR